MKCLKTECSGVHTHWASQVLRAEVAVLTQTTASVGGALLVHSLLPSKWPKQQSRTALKRKVGLKVLLFWTAFPFFAVKPAWRADGPVRMILHEQLEAAPRPVLTG